MKSVKNHIPGILFFLLWALAVLSFWLGFCSPGDEMGYAVLSVYGGLPLCAFIAAIFYGNGPARLKWLFPLFAGIQSVLCQFLTFDLKTLLSSGHVNSPQIQLAALSLFPALLGLGIGCLIRKARLKQSAES